MRLDLAKFREKAAFAQFGSDLDEATQRQLNRGARLVEVLKQPQYSPRKMEDQVLSVFAVINGYADKTDVKKIGDWETGLEQFVKANHADLLTNLAKSKTLSDDIRDGFIKAITEFNEQYSEVGA